MESLKVLLSRSFLFDHTVRAEPLLRPPKNPDLPLRTPAKVGFIREPYPVPVLWLRIPLQHNAAVFHPLFLGLSGAVLLLTSNTTAEVQLAERAANCTAADFNVEAYGGWDGFPRKSTAIKTPFINAALNLYKSFVIKLLLPSAGIDVVRMERPGFEIGWLAKDSVSCSVADVVMSEDLLLCKEPSSAKVASGTKEIDCACDPALLWC